MKEKSGVSLGGKKQKDIATSNEKRETSPKISHRFPDDEKNLLTRFPLHPQEKSSTKEKINLLIEHFSASFTTSEAKITIIFNNFSSKKSKIIVDAATNPLDSYVIYYDPNDEMKIDDYSGGYHIVGPEDVENILQFMLSNPETFLCDESEEEAFSECKVVNLNESDSDPDDDDHQDPETETLS